MCLADRVMKLSLCSRLFAFIFTCMIELFLVRSTLEEAFLYTYFIVKGEELSCGLQSNASTASQLICLWAQELPLALDCVTWFQVFRYSTVTCQPSVMIDEHFLSFYAGHHFLCYWGTLQVIFPLGFHNTEDFSSLKLSTHNMIYRQRCFRQGIYITRRSW
jgi:hypothetical protein